MTIENTGTNNIYTLKRRKPEEIVTVGYTIPPLDKIND